MKKNLCALWIKILTAILAGIGLDGCLGRGFSCVYGGPPEAYRQETRAAETEEIEPEEIRNGNSLEEDAKKSGSSLDEN